MTIALTVLAAVFVWFALVCTFAPEGYENATGYHEGKEPMPMNSTVHHSITPAQAPESLGGRVKTNADYYAEATAMRGNVSALHAQADIEVALFTSTHDYAHLQRANELRNRALTTTREANRLYLISKGEIAA